MKNYFKSNKRFKCIFIIHILFLSFTLEANVNYKGLIAPNGFKVELFSSNIEAPRQMVEGQDYIFVGGIKGKIFAIDKNKPKSTFNRVSGRWSCFRSLRLKKLCQLRTLHALQIRGINREH